MSRKSSPVLYLFALLFLISGAAGLIYQIVWERLLELYFGVTMTSVTLIVSAYLAGLGIGSLVGGRIAHNLKNTLFLYGLIELGIALFGAVSPGVIVWIGQAMAGSSYVLVFLISFGVLLIPTFLMGLTLPFLTQSFVDRVENSGQVIGILYGINTLGAAIGTALAGYILIGFFGLDGTTYIAVSLNALVGLCAFGLARWQSALGTESDSIESTATTAPFWSYRIILISSFLVGFIGLGFEMLWIRVLLIVNKNTAYAFPSILFIFLLGLALGGYYWGRKADASQNPTALFCKIELAGALIAAVTFLLFAWSLNQDAPWIRDFYQTQKPGLPFVTANGQLFFSKRLLLENFWNYFLPILILVLPASLMLGGGLPVLDRIAIQHPSVSGRRVGDIHLANIIGSVAGSLAISFVLLPSIGSEWTLKVLVLSMFIFPAFYFLDKSRQTLQHRTDVSIVVLAALALIGVFLLPGSGEFYRRLYSRGTGQNVLATESGDSILALTYDEMPQTGWFWIGGEINSFFSTEGVYEQRALACAGASQPRRILIIGFGGGYSTLFYQNLSTVDEIVIVELLREVGPFLADNMDSAQQILSDPRVTYIVDDGRRYLNAFPDEKFDLISIDPLRSHTAGHNNLYSEEALRIYQRHLSPTGALCAWMDEFNIIPHTMARVFLYVDQFRKEFMVVSNHPITYDIAYMTREAQQYMDVTNELYGPDVILPLDPASLLQTFVRDQDQILNDERQTPFLRDMSPWLEYYLLRTPASEPIRRNAETVEKFNNRILDE